MKYINKTNPPQTYSDWCNTQRDLGVNYSFGSLQNPEKEDLHRTLVKEQGHLCAYTMKRISYENSHLEHIHPQHHCQNGLDLEYTNLIACFPKGNLKSKCSYGAQKKDNWWANGGSEFISPLNENCELKFFFSLNGEISPARSNCSKAITTIRVLNLNEESLVYDRKKSIEEFIFGTQDLLSPAEADHAIDEIWRPNEGGILHEFCIAIHDALYEYLDIFPKLLQNQNQE
jgi:uncharacterized protein (TIGR02646 family)